MQFIKPVREIPCPRLWKDFSWDGAGAAKLTVTGLGLYRAYLNGTRVGDDYLTPGFNDYDAYLRTQTYDVTDLLQAENHLEVWLGNGWYKGRLGFDGGAYDRWGTDYLLAAVLEADGKVLAETDAGWLASASAIIDGGIYDGEIRDDTREPGEAVPCEITETKYNLVPRFSPAIRVKEELKPALIHTPAGEQVLDFGQNMAGTIRFVNRLPRGKTLRIQTGEVLQQGNFYRDNLRTAKSEFVYTSDGVEKEVEPLFTFFGFRYAKVEGLEQVNPEDFTALCLSSDLKETLQVRTSYPKLNQLMHNSLWGQRSNFLDVPTDCPQRDERLGWTADTQVYVNTACYQMDCKAFYDKFMRDMRADQQLYYHGDIPAFSPSLKGATMPGGAVWADAGTIIPWNVYMHYGDRDQLRRHYPMMRDYTELLIAKDQRNGGTHLVFPEFTFGDWLAQDGMTPQSVKGGTLDAYIQGIYYMNSVRLTGLAAGEIGEAEDAERYAALAEEIRGALLDEYFSPNGNLTVDTQTGYVLALYYGVYRDREKLLKGFRRRLERDFYKITCGFTGAPLMLPVLLDNGMTDLAYRMLLTEEFPGWMYAVNLGATTIWERWNSLNEDGSISGTDMNSLNHYAYGSVCEAVYSRIMGLRNGAPGWKKAIIAPHINARIREASIAYDSAAGRWEVEWKVDGSGKVTLRALVPEDCTAQVILPDHPENLNTEVESGEHEWVWEPTRDYLHVFGVDTPIMDLLDHPKAAAVLRDLAPGICAAVTGLRADSKIMSVAQMQFMHPMAPEELEKLDAALKEIVL